jgi:hypothetical protein
MDRARSLYAETTLVTKAAATVAVIFMLAELPDCQPREGLLLCKVWHWLQINRISASTLHDRTFRVLV